MKDLFCLRRTKRRGGFGRRLAKAMQAYEVTPKYNPKHRLSNRGTVINYGCGTTPIWDRDDIRWVNHPAHVTTSADKLLTFQALNYDGDAMFPTVEYTRNVKEAREWIHEGFTVYCRTLTRASKGKGIVIANRADELVRAPLYTKGVPIMSEFRVFFADGQTVDIIQKKRMGKEKRKEHGLDDNVEGIRNYANGWVFCHDDLDLTVLERQELKDLGNWVGDIMCLDFGAVDVLMDTERNFHICEVNSAPAFDSPTTIERVFPAILEMARR